MKFREHRGSLADSMTTVVEVDGFDGLLAHIRKLAEPWPTFPPVSVETVTVTQFIPGDSIDPRTGWDTHIVTLNDYGVLGFTNGPGERSGN